ELVINSDPCYAFLLDSNSLIQNKLIISHVLAHCDFFKNNIRFSNTRRDMVESMSATAERIDYYSQEKGKDVVEHFLDAVLSIQEHIDPSLIHPKHSTTAKRREKTISPYEDLFQLDNDASEIVPDLVPKKIPLEPEKDLLLYIERHSRHL